jgi:hypothetical protein
MHALGNGLVGYLFRCCEQRSDFHVEAEIGEGACDDLLAAVVAVLAHFGDEDFRRATFVFPEILHRVAHALDGDIVARFALVDAAHEADGRLVAVEGAFERR